MVMLMLMLVLVSMSVLLLLLLKEALEALAGSCCAKSDLGQEQNTRAATLRYWGGAGCGRKGKVLASGVERRG